jgi:hypothetical protein
MQSFATRLPIRKVWVAGVAAHSSTAPALGAALLKHLEQQLRRSIAPQLVRVSSPYFGTSVPLLPKQRCSCGVTPVLACNIRGSRFQPQYRLLVTSLVLGRRLQHPARLQLHGGGTAGDDCSL